MSEFFLIQFWGQGGGGVSRGVIFFLIKKNGEIKGASFV
jgi:hypothetical protein